MKFFTLLCSLLVGLSLSASGDITTSNTAPTENLLISNPTGGITTRLIDEDADSNHARGQIFSPRSGSGSTFVINAITVRKSNNQSYNDSSITLRIFEGTQAQWLSGTGHSTAIDGNDHLVDTDVNLLYTESFDLNGTFSTNNYVTFTLAAPLTINANSDFGFFLVYEQGSGDDNDFLHLEGTSGGRLSISTTSHAVSSRSMVSFVQGVPAESGSGSGSGTPPTLTLGSPFQDRLILQRDKPVNIWGTSDPNTSISVSIAGKTTTGTTDANGKWLVELPATPAGGGSQTLTVTSTNADNGVATETVNDVLFGDVWFCFGQSNMRWRFNNFSAAWETFYTDGIPNNDNIRYLRTIEDGSLTEQDETEMAWLSNSTVNDWSAVATVFAYQLNQATGVPVAVIDSAWGSSSLEGWLPRSMEEDLPHFKEMLPLYQRLDQFRSGVLVSPRAIDLGFSSNEEAITALSGSGFSNGSQANIFMRTRPNIIYNERVHPLRNFGISGFVWYQGEANADNIIDVAQYQFSLPLMVAEYRERFGQGDLPFLGVQLPSFTPVDWPWFREAQDSLLTVPNGYLAVTVDTGSSSTIHPSDKEEVGVRLSLLVREHVLGEAIESDSPRYLSHTVNGDEVTITFENSAGLTTGSRTASPAGFEVAGADQVFHDVTSSSISRDTITVSSSAVSSPIAVRYAWTPITHTVVNVTNGAAQPNGSSSFNDRGLPLAPFRTDDWPLDGLTAQAPFGVNDSYSILRDQTLTIPANGILANDFDLNLDSLEPTLGTTTSNGALTLLPDGSFTYVPEQGFAGEDFFTYQARESAGRASSTTATVNITVEGTPSGYFTWRSTIAWSPGDDQTATGDPDGDGVLNLLEYALGTNPLISDLSGLPSLSFNGNGTVFDFNNVQAGIIYEVQISTDLESWSEPAFATLDSTSVTPVTIPESEAQNGRLFVRLRVTESD